MKEHQQVEWARQDSASPPGPLKAVQGVAPHLGFKEVMACLQRDLLPVTTFKAPLEPMQLEVMVKPAITTMCASHIVQEGGHGDHLYGYHHYFCGAGGPWESLPGNPSPQTHHRGCY